MIHLDLDHPDYPDSLKQIDPPPQELWARGDVSLLRESRKVAIVGSRRASAYGRKVAQELAVSLGKRGIVVVSGFAYGIDSEAHKGALLGGGKTIAVLGCGIDFSYLQENQTLREEICQNGLILSEFPPDAESTPWNFPKRNRIISGLSSVTVVVEADEKSGSLITAEWALSQGKEVYAVPGNITSPLSRGTNRLILQGAAPFLSVEDFLEGLKIPLSSPPIPEAALSREETLLNFFGDERHSIDQLVESSGWSVQEVSTLLVSLEIHGKVKFLPGGRFERIHV